MGVERRNVYLSHFGWQKKETHFNLAFFLSVFLVDEQNNDHEIGFFIFFRSMLLQIDPDAF